MINVPNFKLTPTRVIEATDGPERELATWKTRRVLLICYGPGERAVSYDLTRNRSSTGWITPAWPGAFRRLGL